MLRPTIFVYGWNLRKMDGKWLKINFYDFLAKKLWFFTIFRHKSFEKFWFYYINLKKKKFCVKWCKPEVCILQLICGLPFQLQRTRKQLILCIGRCSANKNLYFHFLFAFFLPIPFYVGLRSKLDWTSEKFKQK